MSLVLSLLQAIVRVDGEALVMHAGDKPYVVTPTGQVDLASRGLNLDAVNGIVDQLLPAELQHALEEFGAVQYELPPVPEFPGEHFTVVVARGGDDVWTEIRRRRVPDDDRVPEEFFGPSTSAPAAQEVEAPPPVSMPEPEPIPFHAAVAAIEDEAPALVAEVVAAPAPVPEPVPAVGRRGRGRINVASAFKPAGAANADADTDAPAGDDDLMLPDEIQLFGGPATPQPDAVAQAKSDLDFEMTEPAALPTPVIEMPAPVAEHVAQGFSPAIRPPVAAVAAPPVVVAEVPAPAPIAAVAPPPPMVVAEAPAPAPIAAVAPPPMAVAEVSAPAPVAAVVAPPPVAVAEVPAPAPVAAVVASPVAAAEVPAPVPVAAVAPPPPMAVAEVPAPVAAVVAPPPPVVAEVPAPAPVAAAAAPPMAVADVPAPVAVAAVVAPPPVVVAEAPEPAPVAEVAPTPAVVVEVPAPVPVAAVVAPPPVAIAEVPVPAPVAAATPPPVARQAPLPPVVRQAAPPSAPLPPVVRQAAPPPPAPLPPVVRQAAPPPPARVTAPPPERVAAPPPPARPAPPPVIHAAAPPAPVMHTAPPPVVEPEALPVQEVAQKVAQKVAPPVAPPPVARQAAPPPPVRPPAPQAPVRQAPPMEQAPSAPIYQSPPPVPAIEAQPPLQAVAEVRAPQPTADVRQAEPVLDGRPPQARLVPPSQPAVVLPISRNPIRAEYPLQPVGDPTLSGLERLLRLSAARGASTLYLSSQSRSSVRVDGELQSLDGEPVLTARDVESLLLTLMPERSHEALRTGAATEWICDIEGVGRVRCMSFRDHRGPGGVFRLMPTRSVSVDQLGLPQQVQALAIEPEGLVLVAGPRSSGKRTLMSAFVDLMNHTRRDHVITIEREINIVHERGNSFISQREVRGSDEDMLAAARAALREDPDVLVIEDLRTGALMNVALEAAASGHLVLGGFSAHTATGAIDRIIDLYAPEYRRQVQLALADSLRGVIVQVLVRKSGGGRLPAREVLLNTPAVSSVIAEGKTSQLPMAIEGGRRYGMIPLNDALVGLVQSGAVDGREAYRQSPDRPGLLAALTRQGVDTSFVERLA